MNAVILVVLLNARSIYIQYAVVFDTPQQCAAAAQKFNAAPKSSWGSRPDYSAVCVPRVQPEK